MSTDTIGASGDFTTIAAWSAVVKAIGTLTEDETGQLIDDTNYTRGAQNDLRFDGLTLDGFTVTFETDGTNTHDGDFGNGSRVEASAAFQGVYDARDCIVNDLSFINTGSGNSESGIKAGVGSTLNRVIAKVDSSGTTVRAIIVNNATLNACRGFGGVDAIFLANAAAILNAVTATDSVNGVTANGTHTGTIKNTVVYNTTTSDWTGTFSGTYSNNASEDGDHPGTSGVTISGDPFEADGFTPSISGQLDGAGVDLSITLDAANLPYAATPAIGAYATLVAAAAGDLLLTNRSIANYQGMRQ